jgi:hypothetical protein
MFVCHAGLAGAHPDLTGYSKPAIVVRVFESCLGFLPASASYALAQFWMELSSNRSDDVCAIILGEATDKEAL